MKKIFLMFLISLILCGCTKNVEENKVSVVIDGIESSFPADLTKYELEKLVCNDDIKEANLTNGKISLKNINNTSNCKIYLKENFSFEKLYTYSGAGQEFIVPKTGKYKIELWGAMGYGNRLENDKFFYSGGKAGYVSGEITLNSSQKLYLFIGGSGKKQYGGFNGGGDANSVNPYGGAGGGATDIRLVNGIWNDVLSLRSRIMVASGGGGAGIDGAGGSAGGLHSYDGEVSNSRYLSVVGKGSDQTSSGVAGIGNSTGTSSCRLTSTGETGSFGKGGNATYINCEYTGGAGGGGYYGGSGGGSGYWSGGASGGSSYISGHTGSVGVTSETNQSPKSGCLTGTTNNSCSIHYSNYTFTNTKMIDGAGYNWTNIKESLEQMPSPNGGYYNLGMGHSENGYVEITYIGK